MRYIISISLVVLFVLGSFLLITPVKAQTAYDIIKRSEDIVRGETQVAKYTITVKKTKYTRTMKMLGWEERQSKKSFALVTAPKKDAGNSFLLIDKDMWQYNPRLQKVIKIDSSMMTSSWMGSDFSNDDIVKESSIVEDYTHKLLGKETVDGHECFKVQLDPKPEAAVVWGKIIYYARVQDYLPVRKEYYNEHGVLKKLLVMGDFKKMHDRVIPTRYQMKTLSHDKRKKDEYTLMIIDEIRFNTKIDSRVFTRQNLQRR